MGLDHSMIRSFLLFITFTVAAGRVCLPGWQAGPSDQNCYLFRLDPKSWEDARTVCEGMKSSLVTVHSSHKQDWLNLSVSKLKHLDSTVKWWVGLSRGPGDTSSWVWVDGMPLNTSISPWPEGYPHLVSTYGATENLCGQYKFRSPPVELTDKHCGIQNPFICQRPLGAPSFCDSSNGWIGHHGMCYKYFDSKKPWSDGRIDCENNGAVLASPTTTIAEQNVFDIAIERHSEVWIGLYSELVGNQVTWQWTDGSTFGNTFWTPKQPIVLNTQRNDSCATILPGDDFTTAWVVRYCEGEKAYICQKTEGSCAPGWKSFGGHCYQFNIRYFLTWDDAFKYCHLQRAKLIQIENKDTQLFVNRYLDQLRLARVDQLWIGLSDAEGNGMFMWSDKTPLFGYRNFPDNALIPDGRRTCQYISTATTDGKWVSGSCMAIRPFVCQVESNRTVDDISTPTPTFTCDENWISRDSQCYLFNDTEVTWSEARQSCLTSGGDLIRVTDVDVQSFINEHLTKAKWIGLNDFRSEGRVVWLNDTDQPTYYNLDTRFKNDDTSDCAIAADSTWGSMTSLGRWIMVSCDSAHGFICQKHALNAGSLTTPYISTPAEWTEGCGPGWEQHNRNCYMFRREQKTWSDARKVCRQNGGDLASISDAVEQSYMTGRAQNIASTWLWIGAQDLSVEGGWGWVDDSPLAFINWNSGQPDNMADSDCAGLDTNRGTWDDLRCDTQNGFICKRKAVSTQSTTPAATLTTTPAGLMPGCEAGWRSFSASCYRVKVASVTWIEARKVCLQQNSDLVSIWDRSEQTFLFSLMTLVPGSFWIGLNSRRQTRSYEWSDNSDVTYTQSWGPGEPSNQLDGNENCVVFNAQGLGHWMDTDCDLHTVTGFICKKPKTLIPTGTPFYDVGCSDNWVGYGTKCYFFIEHPMTFAMAESSCRNAFGHLAIVNDRFVQAFLASELATRSGDYWIGLQTYRSGMSYLYWVDRTRVRYSNWDRAHTGRETHSCVSMRADRPVGLWLNSPCTNTKAFICEAKRTFPSTTRVASPSTTPPVRCQRHYAEFNEHCYRMVKYSPLYTWWEALAVCRREGSNLVSVFNRTESDWIRNHLIRYSTYRRSYWLGLNIIDRSKGYNWQDETPMSYTQWAMGQPDNHNDQEDCVEWETRSNTWRDVSCYIRRGVICKNRKGALPIRPSTPPATEPPIKCGRAPSWQYFNGSCYYFSKSSFTKSWFQALDYYRRTIGGDLLSIGSQDENNFVLTMISKNGGSLYWTGLNELNFEGLEWSDEAPLVYTNWAINEPNDDFGGQKCVQIHKDNGYWYDANCGQPFPFVCKQVNGTKTIGTVSPTTPMAGYCRLGWQSYGNKCYKVFGGEEATTAMNWTSALSACRDFGKGHDLVAIGDTLEQIFVTTLLRGLNNSYWIGLNQLTGYRRFVWTDNSPVTYSHWDSGEPNGDRRVESRKQRCVEMRTHATGIGKWADNHCVMAQGYICQGYKDESLSPPATTTVPSWCKAGYIVNGASCYMIKTDNQTWSEAVKNCEADSGNVVSIGDQFEENFIQLLVGKTSEPVWIGMSDRQLKGIYRWSDEWPVSYTNWGRGEPSRSVDEGCVALVPDGTWTDTLCNNTYSYVCEINSGTPPPHTTPVPGYCQNPAWAQFGSYCYHVSTTYTTWAESHFACRQMGMRLATVHNQDETDFIMKLIKEKHLRYDVWIGLVNAQKSGFKWDDGTPVSYTNWGRNEPSNGRTRTAEDCVQLLRASGQWDDRTCNTRRNAICMTDFVMPSAFKGLTTARLTTPLITTVASSLVSNGEVLSTELTKAVSLTTVRSAASTRNKGAKATTTTASHSSKTSAPKSKSTTTTGAKHFSATTHARPISTLDEIITANTDPPLLSASPSGASYSQSPDKSQPHQSSSGRGTLGGGGIAGISLGIVLAVSFTVLIVVISRRRGHCRTFQTTRSTLRFDNALYGQAEEEGRVQ